MSETYELAAAGEREDETSKDTGAQSSAQADTTEDAAVSEQDSADDAGAETDEEGDGEQPARDSKGRFQKRVDRLTREREEAKREAAYWRGLAEGKAPGGAKQAEPEKSQAKAAPKVEDFEDYADYLEARIEFNRQKRDAEAESAKAASYAAREQAALTRKWEAAQDSARERFADFDEVVKNPNLPITTSMAKAILQTDAAAEIAYHLGTHPEEAAKIAALSPVAQAIAIGRLEATVSKPAPRKVTNAPKPPPTLKGGAVPTKDPSKMSMEEYAAWRDAEESAGR